MKKLTPSFSTMVLTACLLGSLAASAQETSLNGIPSRTYMKARTDAISLNTTPLKAFTTTSISCASKCFFDLTVSAQFDAITPGDVAVVEVNLDGSESNVLPYSVLGYDSTSTGSTSNVRSYTWMTPLLAPGRHTVDVFFFTDAGTAGSFDRTLKVVANAE